MPIDGDMQRNSVRGQFFRRQPATVTPLKAAHAVGQRWAGALLEVLCVTAAAIVAWAVSEKLFGRSHPDFATVIAIVCLAPGLPDHRRRAGALVLGVAIGIGVGEVALLCTDPICRLAIGLFLSISSWGPTPRAMSDCSTC